MIKAVRKSALGVALSIFFLLIALVSPPAFAAPIEWGVGAPAPYEGEEPEEKNWQEAEAKLPEYPRQESLIPFEVSAATRNRFFVDEKSLSVGADRVVRYTLVVQSSAGINNVSYEGLRCDLKQRKLYATGRADKTWAKSRMDAWRDIVGGGPNSAQAVLYKEYFCPQGAAITSADEGVQALKRGGHPLVIPK